MASPNTQTFTSDNFDAEVLKSDKPVLVDFWAEWCQPCRMLGPIIDEVAEDFAGRATVGKVDTDAQTELAQTHGITALPTVLVFNNGEVVNKFVGLTNKEAIAEALEGAAV